MPKESNTGTSQLSGSTASLQASSPRPLLAALILSAILHAALLAGTLLTPAAPSPASDGTTAALEVALLGTVSDPVRDSADDAAAGAPADTGYDGANTQAVAPAPLPAARQAPGIATRTPVVVTRADAANRLDVAQAAVDLKVSASIEPWRPQNLALAWQEQESTMLRERVAQWLEDPEQLLNQTEPLRWQHDGRQYQAAVRHLPAGSATAMERAVVEISTEYDGRQVHSSIQLQRLPFSHYAQFIDSWDPDVTLSEDIVTGRFHSNTAINISTERGAAPQFRGPVSIATSLTWAGAYLAAGMFADGLEMQAGRIDLPTMTMPLFAAEVNPNDSGGQRSEPHYFDRASWITFHATGEYSWKHSPDGPVQGHRTTSAGTVYLIANDGVNLSVQGQLSGQVVVYSPHRISITGHLRYADNPQDSADSPDLLSLISDHTIQIETPSVTGPGDLHIQAAIYAGRRFSVRQFRARNYGMLYIYGSVVAGSMSATEPRYATRIEFDHRLDSIRAPGFPMTDRYALESQDPHWRVAR